MNPVGTAVPPSITDCPLMRGFPVHVNTHGFVAVAVIADVIALDGRVISAVGLVIDPEERPVIGSGTPPVTPWKGNATVSVVPAGLAPGNVWIVEVPDGVTKISKGAPDIIYPLPIAGRADAICPIRRVKSDTASGGFI